MTPGVNPSCRCVKGSGKHCHLLVNMFSAQTHQNCQAATALWCDHTKLESDGVRATLPCTARRIRSAIIALAALRYRSNGDATAVAGSRIQTSACRRTSQRPHRVRRLTSYSQEPHTSARSLYGSTHVTVCSLCFLTWQASLSILISQIRCLSCCQHAC